MDEKRKSAYRYLLYYFLVEIRTIPTPEQPHFSWEQLEKRSYHAGAVAYTLHSLALASTSDFTGFDEEEFWARLTHFSAKNPVIELSHYRKVFDLQLAHKTT